MSGFGKQESFGNSVTRLLALTRLLLLLLPSERKKRGRYFISTTKAGSLLPVEGHTHTYTHTRCRVAALELFFKTYPFPAKRLIKLTACICDFELTELCRLYVQKNVIQKKRRGMDRREGGGGGGGLGQSTEGDIYSVNQSLRIAAWEFGYFHSWPHHCVSEWVSSIQRKNFSLHWTPQIKLFSLSLSLLLAGIGRQKWTSEGGKWLTKTTRPSVNKQ